DGGLPQEPERVHRRVGQLGPPDGRLPGPGPGAGVGRGGQAAVRLRLRALDAGRRGRRAARAGRDADPGDAGDQVRDAGVAAGRRSAAGAGDRVIMTSTRVLVVGSGFIAGEHLNALHQLPDAEIAGIVDLDPGRAAAAARAAGGVPWATDLAAAITEWSADAAIVCTPNHTHPAIGRTLAEAGVHALIEKPLAITPAAAAELVELFEQRGLVLSAAHTHRYAAYARAVREAIVDGAVGRPRHARITLLGGWIWGDWRNWQIDRNRSGGHALHNGVHLLDLVTWWLDDVPTHLHAAGRKRAAADLEVDDYLMITVGYASGATAVCEMSRANQPRGIGYREVFVQGDGGT